MKKFAAIVLTLILTLACMTGVQAEGYPTFDFETKTVTLNSGYEMPILGLGMFSLSETQA